MALGQLASGDFVDAQLRAMQAAIVEQEIDGIDVITGGEMHRRSLVLSDKSEPVQQLQLKELVPQQVEWNKRTMFSAWSCLRQIAEDRDFLLTAAHIRNPKLTKWHRGQCPARVAIMPRKRAWSMPLTHRARGPSPCPTPYRSAIDRNHCPPSNGMPVRNYRNPLPSFTNAINLYLDRLYRGFIRQCLRNRIDLVVVTSRGESEKFGHEIRKPRRARWQQHAARLELRRLDAQAVSLVASRRDRDGVLSATA